MSYSLIHTQTEAYIRPFRREGGSEGSEGKGGEGREVEGGGKRR